MYEAVVKSNIMPDIKEYCTISEAAEREDVPYTEHWIRQLIKAGKVEAVKMGKGLRAMWLVHLPSLLEYVEEMEELGPRKHYPR